MPTTIWKTTLKMVERQVVEMPLGAEILCAREQGDNPCIWYRCDTSQPKAQRVIRICGTGEEQRVPASAPYIGTVFLGRFVFHVFDDGVISTLAEMGLPKEGSL